MNVKNFREGVVRKKLNAEIAEKTAENVGKRYITVKQTMQPGSPINNQNSTINNSVLTVADHLHSAAIHLLRRVRKQDIATGEGPARLSALSVLVFGGPKTLKELAAAEQVKPPTMSRIVSGLKRSRLVEIAHDPEDARRMRITATAKGTLLLQKGREMRIAYLASQLERLTAAELSQVGEAVEILRRLLQNWC